MLRTIRRIFSISLLLPGISFAQKFHFQNYNVQQGLIQSQVAAITQDQSDNLWFCTLGGVSRFDGRVFTNYSETDGLVSNYANTIAADHASNIWIGTAYGISKFNGSIFKSIRFSDSLTGNVVRLIKEDSSRNIWVIAGGKLYVLDANEKPVHKIVSEQAEWVTAMNIDYRGQIWAAVKNKGLFRLDKGEWKSQESQSDQNRFAIIEQIVFDRGDKDRVLLVTPVEILIAREGMVSQMASAKNMGMIMNLFQDRSGRFWIACGKGLILFENGIFTPFNAANGYEGSKTTVVYQDRESNIWFGTSGTGAFRFSDQQFEIYDQFSAAHNANIMPMIEYKDQVYFAAEGAGLFSYDGEKINSIKSASGEAAYQNISALYPAGEKGIYIQTYSSLYLRSNDGGMKKIPLGDVKGCISSIIPDDHNGYWVANCLNLSYVSSEGKSKRILDLYMSRIFPLSPDTILAGSDNGLYLIAKDFTCKKLNNPLLNTAGYMALASLGKYYLIATSNKGFVIYNPATGKNIQLTTKNGLNSDFIYSVVTDHKNQIWLGTGRGINKIQFDTLTEAIQVSNLSLPGDISSAECNQGAALYDHKKNLWFGTVSALLRFPPDTGIKLTYMPPVVLQQVQVFSNGTASNRLLSTGRTKGDSAILNLSHKENHLTFSFRCPSFMHSESILYQYKMEGLEKNYSALSTSHIVDYPSLPAGHYTFRARAYLDGVGYSTENLAYSFDIRAAFYQTLYFKLLMLALLIGIILWAQWLRIHFRLKRIQEIENVKREENIKVRQTASEDFHDEVGNSLTRIQVLTDVLQIKLGQGHDEEKRIISQIKENVSGLYQGTRDILWALNPESDLIKEIGQRLESLGIDVFQDTGICFKYESHLGQSENLRLPGNYNRNIMMIFKEAMSNCMKHARPRHVKLQTQKTGTETLIIALTDDGIGFNPLFVKKGHGFQNMQKRAKRIHANFNVNSEPGRGTRYELEIPVQPA